MTLHVSVPSRIAALATRVKHVRVENKVLFGFLAGLLFMGGFAAVSLMDTRAYLAGNDQVIAIEQGINAVKNLETGLDLIEVNQRNYLLTRDPDYLARYQDAVISLGIDFSIVDSILSGDQALAGELPILHRYIALQLALFAQQVESARVQGFPAALRALNDSGGQNYYTQIHASVERILIVKEQDKFIVQHRLQLRAHNAQRSMLWLAGGVFVLLALVYMLIRKQLTEKKILTQRMKREANLDPLTQLPNRTLLHDWIEYRISQARLEGGVAAVLFIDLDGFRGVNERFGNRVGDAVLVEVARRFGDTARESDFFARVGADQFVILVSAVKTLESVGTLADRLIEVLDEPVLPILYDHVVSASIGVAFYPQDGKSAAELIAEAEQAMTEAKTAGRHRYRYARSDHVAQTSRQSMLVTDLARALGNGELYLVFQPQINIVTRRVIGVEALIRWRHPTLGEIGPHEFIPLAEASGLIVPIGTWVIRTACQQAAMWRSQGYGDLTMAINIAANQMRGEDLVDEIKAALERYQLPAHTLELEMTERILARQHAAEEVLALKQLGVRISIDDFGTGYSSLNYLKFFAIDVIKIDQSFIFGLPGNAFDVAIVGTIIQIAKNLGMALIAEGVENEAQLAFLLEKGCNCVQGYLFSKPIGAGAVLEFVKTWNAEHILPLAI
jgi:diguanylate cyclase (GGDEF)-like protein